MKSVIISIVMVLCLLNTGCLMTGASGKAYNPDNKVTTEVGFWRASLFSITTFEDAEFDYGNVKLKLTKYRNKGDAESLEAMTKLLVYSLGAYSSMGSLPALEAIMEAMKSGEVDRVVAKINRGEELTEADFPVAVSYKERKVKKVGGINE